MPETKSKYLFTRPDLPDESNSRLGDEMQKEQEEVREILKIKDPVARHKALKEYAKRSKSEFSDEPSTEILNLALMQPKFKPKPEKKWVQEIKPEVPAQPKPKKPVQVSKRLRDSIYFKSDEEYESYLIRELDTNGLFQELYEQMKVLYVSRKNIPALTGLWEHLEEMGMTPYQALLEQAEVLIQMEEMDKAFVCLDRAVRLEPDTLAGVRAISIYHKLKREYELAIHWMEKWKKLDVGNAEVYYHLGSILRRTGMKEMAMSELRRCLHLDQNNVMARSLLEKLEK